VSILRRRSDSTDGIQLVRGIGYLSGAFRVSTRRDAEASGPGTHVSNFLSAMRAMGWEAYPIIVGDRLSPRWSDVGSQEKVARSIPGRITADVLRLGMGWLNARRAWREMRTRVEWVYERFAVLQALGGRPQRYGIPWILETNGRFFSEARVERKTVALASLARRLEVAAYRDCDVLVCVTETLRDAVVREVGIRAERVIVVPSGVDADFFDPHRQRPRRVLEGVVLGFVGSLIEWQGIAPLLDALADLKEEGVDLSLVVIGDGLIRGALQEKSHALGVSSVVRFVGRVPFDDVPAYIAGFDLGYAGHPP
jgi:glycosyltransferase involved in cell wall biosynthesis